MAWKGNVPCLEFKIIEDVAAYIRSLSYSSWRPANLCIHNTASPTLYQWWHTVPPAQRMENLTSYYRDELGWGAGPHFFVDGRSWWCMTPPNTKGVHSPGFNGTMIGIECVGDYATESDETSNEPSYPGGLDVMKQAHALVATLSGFFGWDPENLKFHYDDPQTTHACPGKNMVKSEFIDDCLQYMADGGGEVETPPMEPVDGTVANLVAGDTLNIRASSSSSAAVIGTAENGDVLRIVAEAWNGSTRWLRVQFGDPDGSDIAVFGWVSAAYVTVEGVEPPAQTWRENITATEFGGSGDDQDSAYPDVDWINSSSRGIALPFKWKSTPRPQVEVVGPHGTVITDVIDLGPWNYDDPRYVHEGQRPLVEKQYAQKTPAQNGQVPTNKAGIDLTPPIADAVGISGKGVIRWRFV